MHRQPPRQGRRVTRMRVLRAELLEGRSLLTRFAVIGDFGADRPSEAAVAELVKSWNPEFITTVGDNYYGPTLNPDYDRYVGQYYHEFIVNYSGSYGPGSPTPRFFPALGNHDFDALAGQAFTDFFTLPGNERYYDVRMGDVHLFVLNSDRREPDGNSHPSTQSAWARQALTSSDATWKFVLHHHMPYESNDEDAPTPEMIWPFQAWGADAVLNGHEHVYERLEVDGLPYVINGLGGQVRYGFEEDCYDPHSISRFNSEYAATLADVDADVARFTTYAIGNPPQPVDSLHLYRFPTREEALVSWGAQWRYLVTSGEPDATWPAREFDDSEWPSSRAKLGYGAGQATTIGYGGDPGERYLTTYFRKHFSVADPTQFRELALRMVRDDGAVVYLNGQEVSRQMMPAGTIEYSTPAVTSADLGEDDAVYQFYLDPALLVRGENVLSIELHQAAWDSPDLALDVQLVGIVPLPQASVVGRYVFYNNSVWDGNDPAAAASDDAAIAPDKTPLLRGQSATFANYTSYSKGINGVAIDIAGLRPGATLSPDDFIFQVGNDDCLCEWQPAPSPSSVSVRRGAGANGSDRVTVIWPDGAIRRQWLATRILANNNTRLPAADLFFFGNAVGESGNSTENALVTAADELLARVNSRTPLNRAPLDFRFDYNRDSLVNAADQILARVHQTTPLTVLALIRPTESAQPAAAIDAGLLNLAWAEPPADPLRPARRRRA